MFLKVSVLGEKQTFYDFWLGIWAILLCCSGAEWSCKSNFRVNFYIFGGKKYEDSFVTPDHSFLWRIKHTMHSFRILRPMGVGACMTSATLASEWLGFHTYRCNDEESALASTPTLANAQSVLLSSIASKDAPAFHRWVSKVEATVPPRDRFSAAYLASVMKPTTARLGQKEPAFLNLVRFGSGKDEKLFWAAFKQTMYGYSRGEREWLKALEHPDSFPVISRDLGGFGVLDVQLGTNLLRFVNQDGENPRIATLDYQQVCRLRSWFGKDVDDLNVLKAAMRIENRHGDFPVVCPYNGQEGFPAACARALESLQALAYKKEHGKIDGLFLPPVSDMIVVMDSLALPNMFKALKLENVAALKIVSGGRPLACIVNNHSGLVTTEKTLDIDDLNFDFGVTLKEIMVLLGISAISGVLLATYCLRN